MSENSDTNLRQRISGCATKLKDSERSMASEPPIVCNYLVTITSDEEDMLQRVDILNASMFRILKETRLRRVIASNYREGRIVLECYGPPNDPEIATGRVEVTVEAIPQT